MATKLQVWKQALVHLEKATINTLTDDVEARYVFDGAWEGVVEEAFNSGDWNFAKVSAALSASQAGTPAIGWGTVFDYPADYLRTVAVSQYPSFTQPFRDYADEGGFIHTNMTAIYLRYISDAKMTEVESWPTMFWRYVALKLAYDTCGRLTSGDTLEDKIRQRMDRAERKAKSVDARNENGKIIATGSWIRARHSGLGRSNNSGGTTIGGEIVFGEGDV